MKDYLCVIITDGEREWHHQAIAVPRVGDHVTCRRDGTMEEIFGGEVDHVHWEISEGRPGMVVSVWLKPSPKEPKPTEPDCSASRLYQDVADPVGYVNRLSAPTRISDVETGELEMPVYAASQITEAILAERLRIISRLKEEADLTPCAEDAMVTRSNARLIQADFSYEEAERLLEIEEAANVATGTSPIRQRGESE